MLVFFIILVVIASVVLGLIVLVQNPKGGGLSGSIAGFSNQFMGVKQTTDVLEKGTWLFAAVVGILCLLSPMFMSKEATKTIMDNAPVNTAPKATAQPPASNQTPLPVTPSPAAPAGK